MFSVKIIEVPDVGFTSPIDLSSFSSISHQVFRKANLFQLIEKSA